MTYEHKATQAIGLLRRGIVSVYDAAEYVKACPYISDEQRFNRAMKYLDSLREFIGDESPDESWWRDYFELEGSHMQLTEEGWVRASDNTLEATGADPMEVLDEVNAPKTVG